MKILVVMKRFGANKDMVMQNFGRQIRLFEQLAKKHSIDFLCPDYVKKEEKIINRNGMRFFIKPFGFFSFFVFLSSLNSLVKKEKYEVIVATTEPLIGIASYYYSKKFKIPLIYELQDNFGIYDTYKIPFVKYFDENVIKNADVVIAVSESLKKKISKLRKKPIFVIQNGIDLRLFKVIDKLEARQKLKLPLNAKIIVYIGALEKLKGFDIMVNAFNKVRKKYPDSFLLLSGRIDKGINVNQKNIIFRGFPKREDVVLGINTADVAILPNPVNEFSKYCFPYKIVNQMTLAI
ncbi:glycosyltransferase family 4 protein [Candidatus Woesearchaeota archaeon]|nr:glycosyltransferase family 4 protein [Candidatus Woesearchaeota archaeon]